MMEAFSPIGILHTVFQEKFGVPRQSGMMAEARGILKLNDHPEFRQALSRLEEFSHLWIIFVFHKNGREFRPVIDPPRESRVTSLGVFASRSPNRPNPIGMSAVTLDRIDYDAKGGIEIHVSGVDILDGTPVLDIKPYLPYADRIDDANSGWAVADEPTYSVSFSSESSQCLENTSVPRLKELVSEMLKFDPRPTSQRRAFPLDAAESAGKRFAFRVQGYDIRWEARPSGPHVFEVIKLDGVSQNG